MMISLVYFLYEKKTLTNKKIKTYITFLYCELILIRKMSVKKMEFALKML